MVHAHQVSAVVSYHDFIMGSFPALSEICSKVLMKYRSSRRVRNGEMRYALRNLLCSPKFNEGVFGVGGSDRQHTQQPCHCFA